MAIKANRNSVVRIVRPAGGFINDVGGLDVCSALFPAEAAMSHRAREHVGFYFDWERHFPCSKCASPKAA
jgi:hypothetical protein